MLLKLFHGPITAGDQKETAKRLHHLADAGEVIAAGLELICAQRDGVVGALVQDDIKTMLLHKRTVGVEDVDGIEFDGYVVVFGQLAGEARGDRGIVDAGQLGVARLANLEQQVAVAAAQVEEALALVHDMRPDPLQHALLCLMSKPVNGLSQSVARWSDRKNYQISPSSP